MAGMLRQVFRKYPLIPNALVYGTMVVGAEFSQQTLNKRYFDKKDPPEPYDTAVLARYAVVGTVINPNLLYFWYRWLDRAYVGTATKTVLKKLVLDQFLMTPPLLVIFYLSMSMMEGKKDIFEECRQKFVPTFQTSCMFWLPAQMVNFMLVPPVARVVYVGTCSFIWINVLCWIKRNNVSKLEEPLCMFWLPAQMVNFMLVPPVARVVYEGTCSFIWINVLCWIKRNNVSKLEEPL